MVTTKFLFLITIDLAKICFSYAPLKEAHSTFSGLRVEVLKL